MLRLHERVTLNGLLSYGGLTWATDRMRRAAGRHYRSSWRQIFGRHGSNHKRPIWLMGGGRKNAHESISCLEQGEHGVWGRPSRLGFGRLAIQLRLDFACLSKFGGFWLFFHFVCVHGRLSFSARFICREMRSTSFITILARGAHNEATLG